MSGDQPWIMYPTPGPYYGTYWGPHGTFTLYVNADGQIKVAPPASSTMTVAEAASPGMLQKKEQEAMNSRELCYLFNKMRTDGTTDLGQAVDWVTAYHPDLGKAPVDAPLDRVLEVAEGQKAG